MASFFTFLFIKKATKPSPIEGLSYFLLLLVHFQHTQANFLPTIRYKEMSPILHLINDQYAPGNFYNIIKIKIKSSSSGNGYRKNKSGWPSSSLNGAAQTAFRKVVIRKHHMQQA